MASARRSKHDLKKGQTVKAKPAKLQPESEREKLTEAAHMFKADHDEAAFEKRLKKIAKEEKEEAKKPATKQRRGRARK